MFDAISPSEDTAVNPTRGEAQLAFRHANGSTILDKNYASDPLRMLFPTPGPADISQAVIATTSGGLVGGDQLSIGITARETAQALVTPQAAEKIYRSNGATSQISVQLRAETDAWLEWLPQETILFDQARLRRDTMVEVGPGGALFAGEMLVLGRLARGERFSTGYVRDAWKVYCDGRLVWADALLLTEDIDAVRAHPAGLDGANTIATAIFVAEDAADRLSMARDILGSTDQSVRAGATIVNGILVMRWLSADAQALRAAFGEFWQNFRADVRALPRALPRIWHV